MAAGGFDVVLGNPPWERIKLQEQEFFASRDPEIAEAPNAAARGRLIAKLKSAEPGTRERLLHEEFEVTKRAAGASSVFARLPRFCNSLVTRRPKKSLLLGVFWSQRTAS